MLTLGDLTCDLTWYYQWPLIASYVLGNWRPSADFRQNAFYSMLYYSAFPWRPVTGKTFYLWPDLWRHRWPRGQWNWISLNKFDMAFERRLNFAVPSSSFGDTRGLKKPPPTRSRYKQTPPGRGIGIKWCIHGIDFESAIHLALNNAW